MTQLPAHEALSALLISLPKRPLCKTLGCPGCESPHLRPELEALREAHGAPQFDTAATDLLWRAESQVHPEARTLRRSFVYLAVLTPDILPRPVLAVLHRREIALHVRKAQRGSQALLLHALRILPCWPPVCERVSRGELPPQQILKALMLHLREVAQEILQRQPAEAQS